MFRGTPVSVGDHAIGPVVIRRSADIGVAVVPLGSCGGGAGEDATVWAATLPDDGLTGGLSRNGKPMGR